MNVPSFTLPCIPLPCRGAIHPLLTSPTISNNTTPPTTYQRKRRRRVTTPVYRVVPVAVDDSDTSGGRGEGGGAGSSSDARGSNSGKYVPSEDDRAPGVEEDIPTELTLAQQLLMKQYDEQVERMGEKECKSLSIEIVRQMFVKDNILRTMLKKDVNFGVEPPDVDEFLRKEKENENHKDDK